MQFLMWEYQDSLSQCSHVSISFTSQHPSATHLWFVKHSKVVLLKWGIFLLLYSFLVLSHWPWFLQRLMLYLVLIQQMQWQRTWMLTQIASHSPLVQHIPKSGALSVELTNRSFIQWRALQLLHLTSIFPKECTGQFGLNGWCAWRSKFLIFGGGGGSFGSGIGNGAGLHWWVWGWGIGAGIGCRAASCAANSSGKWDKPGLVVQLVVVVVEQEQEQEQEFDSF